MSGIVEAIKQLVLAGVTGDDLVTAIDAIAAAETPKKSAGAERQRRYRERKSAAETVTNDATRNATSDVTLPPSSQEKRFPLEPLPKTQPSTPKNPPAAPRRPNPLTAPTEAIWLAQPIIGGKRRSTRPDVARALAIAARDDEPAEIVAACQAYYRLPDCRKDGGQFAKGAQVLLRDDRWREYAKPAALAPVETGPATSDQLRHRERHFRSTGEWKPEWGGKPLALVVPRATA